MIGGEGVWVQGAFTYIPPSRHPTQERTVFLSTKTIAPEVNPTGGWQRSSQFRHHEGNDTRESADHGPVCESSFRSSGIHDPSEKDGNTTHKVHRGDWYSKDALVSLFPFSFRMHVRLAVLKRRGTETYT